MIKKEPWKFIFKPVFSWSTAKAVAFNVSLMNFLFCPIAVCELCVKRNVPRLILCNSVALMCSTKCFRAKIFTGHAMLQTEETLGKKYAFLFLFKSPEKERRCARGRVKFVVRPGMGRLLAQKCVESADYVFFDRGFAFMETR